MLQPNPLIGSVLEVKLDRGYDPGEEVLLEITYATQPSGQAFSWLNPDQTAGGKLPYMFTQCEDINCRSVVPLQDTPSNRITYSASMTAPSEFVVKMSANQTALIDNGDGTSTAMDTYQRQN